MTRWIFTVVLLVGVFNSGNGQTQEAEFPITSNSFESLIRFTMSVPAGRKATYTDIRIVLFWKSTRNAVTYSLKNVTRLLDDPHFDRSKPTVLYIHGYIELLEDISVQTVAKAYLKHGGYNVLALDWSNFAFGNYISASLNVAKVSKQMGLALVRLLKAGLPRPTLHVVGHSLGAHVAGQAGELLAKRGLQLERITGLDPALPGFYDLSLGRLGRLGRFGQPMGPAAARWTDAVHTDGGRYGTPLKTAHADFWPNGGLYSQPGCRNSFPLLVEEFCHHWRSWRYWAEAVRGGRFVARACSGYDSFQRGDCTHNPLVLMGPDAQYGLEGNFYLRTASTSPFALGDRGAE